MLLAITVSYGQPVGSNVQYTNVYGWAHLDLQKTDAAWAAALDPLGCGTVYLSAASLTLTDSDATGALFSTNFSISTDPLCTQQSGQFLSLSSASADLGCGGTHPHSSRSCCAPAMPSFLNRLHVLWILRCVYFWLRESLPRACWCHLQLC